MAESESVTENDCLSNRERALARAVGWELRQVREEKGWSREQLVQRLSSPIRSRTLLSYEGGSRSLALLRYFDLCQALDTSAAQTLDRAFQRARLSLETLVLEVDLVALMDEGTSQFPGLDRWAHNKVRRLRKRVAVMPPAAVVELADVLGQPPREIARHLAKFIPDRREPTFDLSDHTLGDIEAKLVRAPT